MLLKLRYDLIGCASFSYNLLVYVNNNIIILTFVKKSE